MTISRILMVFLGAIALILVVFAVELSTPGDTIRQTGPGNAQIVFSADHRMVAAPGGCVMVRWQVEHIQAVYFDDHPAVGEGQQYVCVDETTMPVLHIKFADNTTMDYPLDIQFLVEQPSTWLLPSGAILLALMSLGIAVSRPKAGRRRPRMLRLFAVIGILVTSLALTALVLEFGQRYYFDNFGSLQEREAYLDTRAEVEANKSLEVALPFVEYGLSPDYPGQNTLGYRGDEIQVPKPSGTYRIVALGDSTTYGAYLPYDETYPYDLQQVLRDDYNIKNVEVVNGGVPTSTSWNTLIDLAFRVSELQPDLVIVYEGWNDVGARLASPDCYQGISSFLGLGGGRGMRAEPAGLSISTFYRFMAIHMGWMGNPATADFSSIASRIGCTPATEADFPQNLLANPPTYFERNERDMIAIAQANGSKIMFMTWAYDPNNRNTPEYKLPGLAEHNAITTRLAQENGAFLFDFAAVAPTDRGSWIDFGHQSAKGNLEQAQGIAKFLVEQNVIPQ